MTLITDFLRARYIEEEPTTDSIDTAIKKALLRVHTLEEVDGGVGCNDCDWGGDEKSPQLRASRGDACDTLKVLVSKYESYPDFQPEWSMWRERYIDRMEQ
jgi:hypothetical protein